MASCFTCASCRELAERGDGRRPDARRVGGHSRCRARVRAAASTARPRDVLGGRALLALHDVELHLLTLGERLEAAALDGGVMDEAVLLPVGGGDEPEALLIIEPLDGAGRTHVSNS